MKELKLALLICALELVGISVFAGSYGTAKYWNVCDVAAQKANHHAQRPAINYMPE